MTNKFELVVSATDKATAVIKGINETISKATRPISELAKASKSLVKETGFHEFRESLSKVGDTAVDVGKELGALTGPMALIGGAGTIAGIAALADQWGRYGVEISHAAAGIGTTAAELQNLSAALSLDGISGDAVVSSMKGLSTTLHEAVSGRNMTALAMLNQLGVSLHKTASGAIDSKRALHDLADAIQRQHDPATQGFIAQTFGVQGILPVLQKGGAAFDEFTDKVQRNGAAMDEDGIKKAKEFGESLDELKSATTGVGNTIEKDWIPRLKPAVDGITKWISGNTDTAATMTEIGGAAGVAAGAISALSGAVAGLGLVGATLATGGIGAVAAALTAEGFFLAKKSGDAMGSQIQSQADQFGGFADPATGNWISLSPNQAGAIVSVPPAGPLGIRNNNPLNLRPGGSYAKYGTPEEGLDAAGRQLLRYQGRGIDTLGGIIGTWAPASDGNDVGAYVSDVSKRTGFGSDQHLDLKDPSVLAALMSAMIQHENGNNPYSAGQIAAEAQKVTLEVLLKNAPPGTSVTARDASGASMPTRVEYSMPGGTLP
jgi:hypothetical protein